ncbi:hypothetical protein KUCAC02_025927 [Chaenocephalus aceratus]|uniref:Uncharacterized protein n=1 Tax=Chaenocephalus aceratus TaxID=36190 RepID=A0ACB9VWH9_CHAAC|nr:hypothetical protein KUCAC02_025927 [Chaenocephalus aceratus]
MPEEEQREKLSRVIRQWNNNRLDLESSEHGFLSAVINYTNSSTVHFHLSPAFILYAAARSALKTQRATEITNKMAAMTGRVIQARKPLLTLLHLHS